MVTGTKGVRYMLKTRFIKLMTTKLGDGRFLLTAQNERGSYMAPFRWKNLVFSSHEESFLAPFLRQKP